MTLHTRAATDDIYDIFNAPLKPTLLAGDETGDDDDDDEEEEEDDDDDEDADEDEDMTDAFYGSDAESTGTTRQTHQGEQEDVLADTISIGE